MANIGARLISLLLVISAVALLNGCQEKSMRDKIREFHPVIMTDEEGNRYVVEHNGGNVYTVKPLTENGRRQ